MFILLGRSYESILIHDLQPMVWFAIQRLGRNLFGKLMTRKSKEEICR